GTVVLTVPAVYHNNSIRLLAEIEKLPVETDQVAKIVIDEASGTIVMGENVRIDTVAVAQGNLVVRVEEKLAVVPPDPLGPPDAEPQVQLVQTLIPDAGPGKNIATLAPGATLKDLVAGLN